MSDLTVVINVYNEEEDIPRLLDLLESQTLDEFEVLFVDDGSEDSSADVIDNYRGSRHVRLISRSHQGLAAARVTGLLAVDHGIAVVVDADMTFEADWLAAVGRAFNDETVGGAFSRVGWSGSSFLARGGQAVREVLYALRRSSRNPWMAGAGMAIRARALGELQIDVHDFYAEDVEISQLLSEAGWRIVTVDSPPIETEDPETASGIVRRHFRVGRRTAHLIRAQPGFMLRLSNVGRFFPFLLIGALAVDFWLGALVELATVGCLVLAMVVSRVKWHNVGPGILVFHIQTLAAAAGTVSEALRMIAPRRWRPSQHRSH